MKRTKEPTRRPARTTRSAPPDSRRNGGERAAPVDSSTLLQLVTASLEDDQGDDVVEINLAGKTALADYMVVCTGRNSRHIGAMAEHLKEKIKKTGLPSPPIEGLAQADWVLIDAGDVIIHLFRPEMRAFYNLEKMWGGPWSNGETTDAGAQEDDPPGEAGR